MTNHQEIQQFLQEGIDVKQRLIASYLGQIAEMSQMLVDTYKHKKKVLVCGNGGSASDAMHMVGELVGRYKIERPGLHAVSLTADNVILTAVGNDYGYDQVFSRQVEGLGNEGDLFIGISTSGNSPNVIEAVKKAKQKGMRTLCLLGRNGGKLASMADASLIIPSDNTPRIQECHIAVIHIMCELLDKELSKEMMVQQ